LQSRRQTRAFYNKIAKIYNLLSDRFERPMRIKAFQLLEVQPGERILEIGCGTGRALMKLAQAVQSGGCAYGFDLSSNMLKASRAVLLKENLIDWSGLSCVDAVNLPVRSESIDGVFMSFTLELFDTPEIPQVLRECMRALRPHGRIAVVGVSKEGKRRAAIRAFEWMHRHFPSLMDCRPIYIQRALTDAGFRIQTSCCERAWTPIEIALGIKE